MKAKGYRLKIYDAYRPQKPRQPVGPMVSHHGNGVRIGVAFLRYAGVAAVYIIYKYRGNGGQRVADKTLVGVC